MSNNLKTHPGAKVKLSIQVSESDRFWHFCGYNVKTFNNLPSINQIKFAIDARQPFSKSVSAGCNKPVYTRSTLWRQHFVTTSKEYSTISQILSKYFELVFLQVHLMKISCKLIIIWLNYERKKKGAFLWNTVYSRCQLAGDITRINLRLTDYTVHV